MIILPEKEEILDFVCGDKDFWVVSGGQNLAYVKPAKAGATTNLNLVTASGNIYSFLLTEGTRRAGPEALYRARRHRHVADERAPRSSIPRRRSRASSGRGGRPEGGAGGSSEPRRRRPTSASPRSRRRIRRNCSSRIASRPTRSPFTSRRSTRTASSPTSRRTPELPALYEVKDGAPNLINFQVEHGVYIVPKVLERGYLAIGKQRWCLRRRAERGRDASTREHQRHPAGRVQHAQPVIRIGGQPRGVLPRQLQMWLMVGLAVVILVIIFFTGRPTPRDAAASGTGRPTEPALAATDRIRTYQQQLADDEARQRQCSLSRPRPRPRPRQNGTSIADGGRAAGSAEGRTSTA